MYLVSLLYRVSLSKPYATGSSVVRFVVLPWSIKIPLRCAVRHDAITCKLVILYFTKTPGVHIHLISRMEETRHFGSL